MKIKKMLSVLLVISMLLLNSVIASAASSDPSIKFGAKVYDVQIPNTGKVTVHEPPAGWNPLNASAEELSYFGFPARPSDLKALGEWKKLATAKFVKPVFDAPLVANTNTSTFTLTPNTIAAPASANWCGYAARPTGGVCDASGNWIVPTVTSSNPANNDIENSCEWVGLGGQNQGDALVQIGTCTNVLYGTAEYSAFFELVHTNFIKGDHQQPVIINNTAFPVAATNHINASVFLNNVNTSTGTATANFSIFNSDAPGGGIYTAFSEPVNTGVVVAETQADFIYEHTGTANNTVLPAPNVVGNKIYFSSNYFFPAGTTNSTLLSDSSTTYTYTMVNDLKQTMASPSTPLNPSDGSFIVNAIQGK